MSPDGAAPTVCVIGGGLAGLSAALECADAGAQVTVLESRPRLGGATFSFERDGLVLDNGQHVILRCCTAYLQFLRRLGVAGQIAMQDRLSIPILRPGGLAFRLERTDLPAPLHLAGAVAAHPLLSAADKLQAVRAIWALRRLDPDDPRLDAESFGDWLRRHGQRPHVIASLWELISVPTLNVRADECSLALAAMVFRTGLLDRNDAADLGVPKAPLSTLHVEPARAALLAAGAAIRTSCRVTGVRSEAGRVQVGTREGPLSADAAILAVPHDLVGGLLPAGTLRSDPATLGFSPIVNLHIGYDRPVTTLRFAAGLQTPVDWIFVPGERILPDGVGQYLTVSLSAADRYLSEPVATLRERFVPELAQLFPGARRAGVRRFHVTREPHATFRATPGTARVRAGDRTNLPGVFLAGSWTDTGWPATMEGAVRSGVRAARRALRPSASRATPEGVTL